MAYTVTLHRRNGEIVPPLFSCTRKGNAFALAHKSVTRELPHAEIWHGNPSDESAVCLTYVDRARNGKTKQTDWEEVD